MDLFAIIWIGIIIVFFILEVMSAVFVALCFSVAALVALVFNLLGFDSTHQIISFIGVLIITLIFLMPFLRRVSRINTVESAAHSRTNLDLVIGQTGICVERITNLQDGLVKVDGKVWTAKSDVDIDVDELVIVEQITGARIIVSKK